MIIEKISEGKFDGSFEKEYSFDNKYGVTNIINKLLDKNYNIKYVDIMESDSDIGEKRYQGTYSTDTFLKLYDLMDKSEITSYGIIIDDENIDSIIVVKQAGLINAYFKNPNIELDSILNDSMELK